MGSSTMTLNKEKISTIIDVLILLYVLLMIVSITGIILYTLFPESEALNLIIIGISMGLGFCLTPYLYLKSKYKITTSSLGIKSLSKFDYLLLILVFCGISSYLLMTGKTIDLIFLNFIQMIIVASTEEFWARGVICYLLDKIYSSPLFVLIVSSVCFAFFTHLNEPFFDNLLYRLPGAFILGFIYIKTRNLLYSILIHFSYNMLVV